MSRRLTFVGFHGLGPPPATVHAEEVPYWVPVEAFEHVLDLVAARDDMRITFDDGLATDRSLALERLERRSLRASFFVLADKLGQPGYLTPEEVLELDRAGMSIGLHGQSHRPWTGLDASALREELDVARERLADLLGGEVTEAACPFGAYDRRVLGELERRGFARVYTSDGGRSEEGDWLVARNTVVRDTRVEELERIADGREGALVRGLRRLKRFSKRLR